MPRQTLDFTVIKSKCTPYYKGKIRSWTNYRSTGETTRGKAEKITRQWFEESLSDKSVTFGENANRFYKGGLSALHPFQTEPEAFGPWSRSTIRFVSF